MFDAAQGHPPFQPIRDNLYRFREFVATFSHHDPQSIEQSLDFRIFRCFVANGRTAPRNPHAGRMQALHDGSRATWAYLDAASRPAAAIMGGHGEARGSST